MLKLFTIPKYKMELFNKRIAKMSNKAKRLGLPEYKVEILGEEVVELKQMVKGRPTTYNVPFVKVQVEGEAPQIEGYKLIALLEQLNGENIVKRFDRESESTISTESLIVRDTSCDHCSAKRNRKYVFILENEQGELIQVGKACLKDYTNCNFSAESIAKYYEDTNVLYEFENVDETDHANYGYNVTLYKLDEVLAVSMYFTNTRGYFPSSYNDSTKNTVSNFLFRRNEKEFKKDFENVPELPELVEMFTKEIETIKEYYGEQNGGTDYIHNLKVILKGKYIEYKHFGYTVSAYSSYLKAMKRDNTDWESIKAQREAEKAEKEREQAENMQSEYVGEVGQRGEFSLTFDKLITYEGFYGVGYMYFFKDGEGNVFLWGTNKDLELEENQSVQMVGTIKEHKEFKDVKQTVITRCKMK